MPHQLENFTTHPACQALQRGLQAVSPSEIFHSSDQADHFPTGFTVTELETTLGYTLAEHPDALIAALDTAFKLITEGFDAGTKQEILLLLEEGNGRRMEFAPNCDHIKPETLIESAQTMYAALLTVDDYITFLKLHPQLTLTTDFEAIQLLARISQLLFKAGAIRIKESHRQPIVTVKGGYADIS